MLDQKLLIDIHIIKFQDYVRRKPNRPFGYYGLGVQYKLAGKPAMADKLFTDALKHDPHYIPALLGKLEILLDEKRYAAAARFYDKNRALFCRKKIYIKRINRMTSSLYMSKSTSMRGKNLFSRLVLKENQIFLTRIQTKSKNNPVSNILLSIFRLKSGRKDEKTLNLFRFCLELDEINDKLRWDLLKVLSEKEPKLLFTGKIAGLFSSIPENAFGTDYADFLMINFINSGNVKKVMGAFSGYLAKHMAPGKKVLWRYLYFLRERNIWDPSLSYCCQKLIDSGWGDHLVAGTIKELYKRGMWDNLKEMENYLSLYEYAQYP
ncbi:MAG: hypothetical protein GX045_00190 [Clostridiaceae bacterium]|nr:hypothetical protein [Clostridiaceae bacterium]